MLKINKRLIFATLSMLLLAFTFVAVKFYSPVQAEEPATVILKAGVPVALRLIEEVKPATKNVGDIVHFEVVGDVKVGRDVVIKAGAPAEGEVTICEKAEMLGRPEKIAFIARSAQAVDGSRVALRATLTREGVSKETKALGLGMFVCPLFVFEKGGRAEFPTGTEIKAYVDYDTEIKI